MLRIPSIFLFCLLISSCSSNDSRESFNSENVEPLPQLSSQKFGPEALFPNGIEKGDASKCEAPDGNKCWYVFSEASADGDGTFASPFNSFEKVVGYEHGNGYSPGLLRGGDYLYVRGLFPANKHDAKSSNQRLILARPIQGGSRSKPTVIKSWPGFKRAIFDGEYKYIDMLGVRNVGGEDSAIIIQNIELTRGLGRGISISDGAGYVSIIGIVGHKTQGNGIMGTGGVVNFTMRQGVNNFSVTNSMFYSNNINPTGSLDNIGAIGITSEKNAGEGSNIEIAYNLFDNEEVAIRQKHAGNIRMDAHHNKITNCSEGFHLRAFENQVTSNLIDSTKIAFRISEGNAQGDTLNIISSNIVTNSKRFVEKISDSSYVHEFRVFDNSFSSKNSDYVLNLGQFSNIMFEPNNWQSGRNVFDVRFNTFMTFKGKKYGFRKSMKILNDKSSKLK